MTGETKGIARVTSRKGLSRVFGVFALALASFAVMPSEPAAGAARLGTVSASKVTCNADGNIMYIEGSATPQAGINDQSIAYHFWIQPVAKSITGAIVNLPGGGWTEWQYTTFHRVTTIPGLQYGAGGGSTTDSVYLGREMRGIPEAFYQVWTEVWFYDGGYFPQTAKKTLTYHESGSPYGASTDWCRTFGD
jgi:hypothetical protein